MTKRTTLKSIAEKLNVSIALVSYVINNKGKEMRVSDKMVKKIKDVAAELNYKPNHVAKSLRSKRQMSIGCIVDDISNPFFSELARNVEDHAHEHGYTVVFGSSDEDLKKFRDLTDFFISRQLDGILIAPPEGSKEDIIKLKEYNIPIVLLDRYYNDVGLNGVVVNNYWGAKKVVEQLLQNGLKKVGMISYESEMEHFCQRERGYVEALKEAGIKYSDDLIKKINYKKLRSDVQRAIDELVNEIKVDAIFFQTNSLTLEGLKHIVRKGYKIPDDFEVVAFDESEVYHFFNHPINYVEQPLMEMAKKAVSILLDEIDNKKTDYNIEYIDPKISCCNIDKQATNIKG
ncbi:MAG: substrate-binding domain-containing protein [Bacteroidota bacterium]